MKSIKLYITPFILLLLSLTSMTIFAKRILPIKHWQTANNIPVYFVQTKNLPILDLRVIFQAGSICDGKQYGLSAITNNLIGKATQKLNADQIAEKFDRLGTLFDTNVSRDIASINMRTLTFPKKLDDSIALLHNIITKAKFPQKDFSRMQIRTFSAISEENQNPGIVANKIFYKTLYQNFPYGHAINGTRRSISQLTNKAAETFYKKYYTLKNAAIVMVGDVSSQKAHHIAQKLLTGLPKGKKTKIHGSPTLQHKAVTVNIAFPSSQTFIRIGCVGINYQNKNFFPLIVGNAILGGGDKWHTRIFNALRQKEGLTYTPYSTFIPLRYQGPFLITFETNNQHKDYAIKITRNLLKKFIQNGPTQKELYIAKKYLTGSFLLNFDSNLKITHALSLMAAYQLPLNYFDAYLEKLNKVTPKQIRAAYQQLFKKQALTTITVGK